MRVLTPLIVFLAFVTLSALSQQAKAESDGVSPIREQANVRAPASVSDEDAVDFAEFDHVDPKHLVPDVPLKRAITYFKQNQAQFGNKDYIAVVDFTRPSNEPRMFIVNLKTGVVNAHLTTHGMGSDPGNTGRVHQFSNVIDSEESSYGFYRTAEIYMGKHLRSMRLDGLSPSNSNARVRDIVIHAAWYVTEAGHHAGRSDGCFAVDPIKRDAILAKLQGGALLYGWSGKN